MKRTAVTLFLLTVPIFGAEPAGVRPRPDRTEYAVTMFNDLLAVAAELVPAEKVRKQFGPEVDSHYLVVEVGVYPRVKHPIDVRPGDFTVRVNRTRNTLSPLVPKAIIAVTESLRSIALELLSKCLPETATYKPVAGYLFFPLQDKTEDDHAYELEYKTQRARMILPLHAGIPR
jgi:hypothetical protein